MDDVNEEVKDPTIEGGEEVEEKPSASESVLISTKKMIGILEDNTTFDLDVKATINSAISILDQLGVMFAKYSIESENDTYRDLLPDASEKIINWLKTYFAYKSKMGIDSSSLTGAVLDVYNREIKQLEWRLQVAYETKDGTGPEEGEIQNE